ncbi:cation:H+ antiporter [Streptomyces sp. DvalAA-21]|nr:sodium/calcium exchanger membrane region [Streptomyces sp. SirexAA-E]PZX36562.1 cation:H+ antiporter [Streptomyces sp. DvalAA-21]RAJ31531.1 cation:H+ antiporter [Streptomyces sp. DpondAA-E10]RAJ46699.1 cation:H+ antiporter [Streptomyces sp. DpondAA-A50]SCD81125.1 cation:H+ antiporter [Streptomyces sp. DpondAA-F4a]SCL93895.1 cation:H+ antiporter [Streptomyces sp. DpondAA-F4]
MRESLRLLAGGLVQNPSGGRDLRLFADDAWPPRRRGRTPGAAAPVHAVRESGAVGVIHVVLLVVCAVAIYLSCEWFVNAVEWLGRRLDVGKMAVGTILAAFGTALPESVVTLVAVTTGATEEARNIGVGAAMGGPLALSTVAYGVTGAMLLLKRREQRRAVPDTAGAPGAGPRAEALGGEKDMKRLAKDQQWFLPVFVVKVALGLVAFAFKPVLGLLFFGVYAVYFWREIRSGDDGEEDEELEPLKLRPRSVTPPTWAVAAQTLATLVVIFLASQLFVRQLDAIGPMLGLSTAVTALLLSPIATELPEIMNAIIWVRQGKTRLALANISGAMMIQATVPSGLGLLFTSWSFDHALLWAGLVTMAAIVYLLTTMRAHRLTPGRLAVAALFYVAFALGLIPLLA